MKTLNFYALIGTLALAMVFVSCSKEEDDTPFYSATNGTSKQLSNIEKEGLLSLAEVQKMHRDVYDAIASETGQELFATLSEKDARLMEKLSVKIDKYGLPNPLIELGAGEYEDAGVQNTYNQFMRTSSFGLDEMLDFATAMEEDFINAVRAQKSSVVGNADIVQLYDEMLTEANIQIDILDSGWEEFSYIYAPRDEHRDD
jgi:hypothetical protein